MRKLIALLHSYFTAINETENTLPIPVYSQKNNRTITCKYDTLEATPCDMYLGRLSVFQESQFSLRPIQNQSMYDLQNVIPDLNIYKYIYQEEISNFNERNQLRFIH